MSLKHIPLLVCALAASDGHRTARNSPPPSFLRSVESEACDTTVKQDSVRRATVALAARVTDMRKWVDSAAGVSMPGRSSTALAPTNEQSRARQRHGGSRALARARQGLSVELERLA